MNRTTLALLALALTASPTLAQAPAPNPESQPAKPRRRPLVPRQELPRVSLLRPDPLVEERLKLTPQQKEQITQVATRFREATAEKEGEQTPEQRREAFEKQRQAQLKAEQEAEAVLTPQQKQQLATLRADAEALQFLGRYSFQLLAVPNLSDPQRQQLRQLAVTYQQKRSALMQGVQLRDPAARKGLQPRFRELDQELQTSIKNILTPEQHQAFERGSAARSRP